MDFSANAININIIKIIVHIIIIIIMLCSQHNNNNKIENSSKNQGKW